MKKDNEKLTDLLISKGLNRRTKIVGGLVLAGVLVGGFYTWQSKENENTLTYVTQEAHRDALSVTVTADGTLKPMRTVTLGSELSGIVREVAVDVNDSVKTGDVLIELDRKNLTAKVEQACASVKSAEAKYEQAKATVNESRLKLKRMQELNRLSNGVMPTRTELEAQEAKAAKDRADLIVARTQISSAKATLLTAENDLEKASIKSPIDGVVLARSVEPGYAVAASLQAVELLSLASDLRELELQVQVDEADIGVVKVGQQAYFTVSSYPDRRFPAVLKKVAFGAQTNENVVTYTTYLDVDNTDMLLRPGMTASATILTSAKDDALLVPNSAFRYSPRTKRERTVIDKMAAQRHGSGGANKTAKETAFHGEQRKTLYVLRDGRPERISVLTGLTDGIHTEILSDELKPGESVVVDQHRADKKR